MAKRQADIWPSANWTSLIDIIFQLLIFFMVTLALGTVERQARSQSEGKEKEDLPQMPGMVGLGEALDITPGSVLIHVAEDAEDEVKGNLVVYLLNHEIPSVKEAKEDSLHRAGPFSWDVAYSKLERQIRTARTNYEPMPRVEMRAYEGTPYGKVLDIMKLCYHEEEPMRINQVYFRFARLAQERLGGK
ncbi:hypothetical protein DRQ36_01490 [bacterium]|nr:MAG: hypothetical protein DRQ36_01490 [bacterium]